MVRIESALPSPRIVNGTIMWYAGDQIELAFKLCLSDADGDDVMLTERDTAEVEIKNDKQEAVKRFVFEGASDNILSLAFDKETTALFKPGQYFYDIRLSGTYNTTIAKENPIRVE